MKFLHKAVTVSSICCKSDCFAVLLVLNSADIPEDITTGYNNKLIFDI